MENRILWICTLAAVVVLIGLGSIGYSMHRDQARQIDLLQKQFAAKDHEMQKLSFELLKERRQYQQEIKGYQQTVQEYQKKVKDLQSQVEAQKKSIQEVQNKVNF